MCPPMRTMNSLDKMPRSINNTDIYMRSLTSRGLGVLRIPVPSFVYISSALPALAKHTTRSFGTSHAVRLRANPGNQRLKVASSAGGILGWMCAVMLFVGRIFPSEAKYARMSSSDLQTNLDENRGSYKYACRNRFSNQGQITWKTYYGGSDIPFWCIVWGSRNIASFIF